MPAPFDPALTGQVSTTLGPLWPAPLTSPLSIDRFVAAGFDRGDWAAPYFAFRSAPLGRATAETVIATYFNFSPEAVRRQIPRVWDIAEPEVVIDVLLDAIDALMTDALADFADTPELRELAELLTEAATTAFARPEGRPLFAGLAGIPWPDAPPAQVWFGMHALREFRGDGHVAVLTSRGLTGIEALVLHGAMGVFPAEGLRASREWPQDQWDAAVDGLRARGLLRPDEVLLSDDGKVYRDAIETQTDELAMPAFTGIGEQGVHRILELAPPIVAAVATATRPARPANTGA